MVAGLGANPYHLARERPIFLWFLIFMHYFEPFGAVTARAAVAAVAVAVAAVAVAAAARVAPRQRVSSRRAVRGGGWLLWGSLQKDDHPTLGGNHGSVA